MIIAAFFLSTERAGTYFKTFLIPFNIYISPSRSLGGKIEKIGFSWVEFDYICPWAALTTGHFWIQVSTTARTAHCNIAENFICKIFAGAPRIGWQSVEESMGKNVHEDKLELADFSRFLQKLSRQLPCWLWSDGSTVPRMVVFILDPQNML